MAEPLTIGVITTAVGAILGYGKLQANVNNNTKAIDKLATDEKLDLVHTSLDGRLDRIEKKLDELNKAEWLSL